MTAKGTAHITINDDILAGAISSRAHGSLAEFMASLGNGSDEAPPMTYRYAIDAETLRRRLMSEQAMANSLLRPQFWALRHTARCLLTFKGQLSERDVEAEADAFGRLVEAFADAISQSKCQVMADGFDVPNGTIATANDAEELAAARAYGGTGATLYFHGATLPLLKESLRRAAKTTPTVRFLAIIQTTEFGLNDEGERTVTFDILKHAPMGTPMSLADINSFAAGWCREICADRELDPVQGDYIEPEQMLHSIIQKCTPLGTAIQNIYRLRSVSMILRHRGC